MLQKRTRRAMGHTEVRETRLLGFRVKGLCGGRRILHSPSPGFGSPHLSNRECRYCRADSRFARCSLLRFSVRAICTNTSVSFQRLQLRCVLRVAERSVERRHGCLSSRKVRHAVLRHRAAARKQVGLP